MRLNLALKLVLPVAFLAIIAAALSGLSYVVLEQGRELSQRADLTNQKAFLASEIRASSRAVQRDLLNMILDKEANGRNSMADSVDRRIKQMQDYSGKLTPLLDKADRAILGNFDNLREQVIQSFGAVRQLAMAGKPDEAYQIFVRDVRSRERAMSAVTDPFITEMEKQSDAASKAVQEQAMWAERVSAVLSIVGILVGLGLALAAIFQWVVRPIRAMTGAMLKLAERQWQTEVPGTTRTDEIGAMAKAVLVFRENGMEADRLTAAAEAAEAEREARRQTLEAAIAEFQSRAGMVMSTVVSASANCRQPPKALPVPRRKRFSRASPSRIPPRKRPPTCRAWRRRAKSSRRPSTRSCGRPANPPISRPMRWVPPRLQTRRSANCHRPPRRSAR